LDIRLTRSFLPFALRWAARGRATVQYSIDAVYHRPTAVSKGRQLPYL
jgi:hypothetical protein